MPKYEGVRRCLMAAFAGWRAREKKSLQDIQGELAPLLGVKEDTIQAYQLGDDLPPYPRFKILVHTLARHAYLGPDWLSDVYSAYFDNFVPGNDLLPDLPVPVPAHSALPLRENKCIERTQQRRVVAALQDEDTNVVVVHGIAGIGKSSLVWKLYDDSVAQRPEALPFDGLIWVNASRLPNGQLLDAIIQEIQRVFPYATAVGQASPLWGRRKAVLLVLDNIASTNLKRGSVIVDWIKNLPASSKVLITCTTGKAALTGLPAAWKQISVDGMGKTEAQQMILQHVTLSLTGTQLTDQDWSNLLQITHGNPKALELTIAYLKNQDSLAHIMTTLQQSPDTLLDSLFQLHWTQIQSDSVNRSVLLAMALFPGKVGIDALHAVTKLPYHKIEQAIRHLNTYALIEFEYPGQPLRRGMDGGRVYCHGLVWDFAKRRFENHLDMHQREAQYQRWIDYYYQYIQEVLRRPLPLDIYWAALIGEPSQNRAHSSQNLRLLEQEWANILYLLSWLAKTGHAMSLVDYMLWLSHFTDHRGLYHVREKYAHEAATQALAMLTAAQAAGDSPDPDLACKVALLFIDTLGWLYFTERKHTQALAAITQGQACLALIAPNQQSQVLYVLADIFYLRITLTKIDGAAPAQRQQLLDEAKHIADRIAHQSTLCPDAIQLRLMTACGETAYARALAALPEEARQLYNEALHYFDCAQQAGARYGGEAGSLNEVQVLQGFTYLALQQANAAEQALARITSTFDPMARLWATYGRAWCALLQGQHDKAELLEQEVTRALPTLAPSVRIRTRLPSLRTYLQNQQLQLPSVCMAPNDLVLDVHIQRAHYYRTARW